MLEAAGDNEVAKEAKARVKVRQSSMGDFISGTGRTGRYDRERTF